MSDTREDPSLYEVCLHLEFAESDDPYINQSGKEYVETLTSQRNFQLLARAEKARKTGKYLFLKDLNTTFLKLVHWAEDTHHAVRSSKRQIQDLIRREKAQARVNCSPDDLKRAKEQMIRFDKLRAEMGLVSIEEDRCRTVADTDFPTKESVLLVFETVFPEHSKWIPKGSKVNTASPASMSKMWKDAGLHFVRKGSKETIHPNILKNRDLLIEWKKARDGHC